MHVYMFMRKNQREGKSYAGKTSLSREGGWNLRSCWEVEPLLGAWGSVCGKGEKAEWGAHVRE